MPEDMSRPMSGKGATGVLSCPGTKRGGFMVCAAAEGKSNMCVPMIAVGAIRSFFGNCCCCCGCCCEGSCGGVGGGGGARAARSLAISRNRAALARNYDASKLNWQTAATPK